MFFTQYSRRALLAALGLNLVTDQILGQSAPSSTENESLTLLEALAKIANTKPRVLVSLEWVVTGNDTLAVVPADLMDIPPTRLKKAVKDLAEKYGNYNVLLEGSSPLVSVKPRAEPDLYKELLELPTAPRHFSETCLPSELVRRFSSTCPELREVLLQKAREYQRLHPLKPPYPGTAGSFLHGVNDAFWDFEIALTGSTLREQLDEVALATVGLPRVATSRPSSHWDYDPVGWIFVLVPKQGTRNGLGGELYIESFPNYGFVEAVLRHLRQQPPG